MVADLRGAVTGLGLMAVVMFTEAFELGTGPMAVSAAKVAAGS